jgi:hypothetical protein
MSGPRHPAAWTVLPLTTAWQWHAHAAGAASCHAETWRGLWAHLARRTCGPAAGAPPGCRPQCAAAPPPPAASARPPPAGCPAATPHHLLSPSGQKRCIQTKGRFRLLLEAVSCLTWLQGTDACRRQAAVSLLHTDLRWCVRNGHRVQLPQEAADQGVGAAVFATSGQPLRGVLAPRPPGAPLCCHVRRVAACA